MPGFEATIDHSSGNIQFSGKNAASFVKLLQSKVNFDPYPTQIRMGVQYNWPNGLPS